MLILPPVIAELAPAIMGGIVAASGWGLALFTRRVERANRRSNPRPSESRVHYNNRPSRTRNVNRPSRKAEQQAQR